MTGENRDFIRTNLLNSRQLGSRSGEVNMEASNSTPSDLYHSHYVLLLYFKPFGLVLIFYLSNHMHQKSGA